MTFIFIMVLGVVMKLSMENFIELSAAVHELSR